MILRSAFASAIGLCVICAPVASAAYSRLRDTAIRKIGVIIQLNTINASHTIIRIAAPLFLLSLSFPLTIAIRRIISAANTVTPTPVISIISSRMSRLPICAISWAITPSSSNLFSFLIIPRVSATDASRGVRPVANAFIESSSMIYTRGRGSPAAIATFSTLRKISRFSASVSKISCACAEFSIIESPNAHDISSHTAHAINVGIATRTAVSIAICAGATIHVNRNISAIKINGKQITSNMVFILLLRIWSYTVLTLFIANGSC